MISFSFASFAVSFALGFAAFFVRVFGNGKRLITQAVCRAKVG
jgi:hypothetical protein